MSDPQPFVGQQLDQFQIQKHIARGGMADVYLGYDIDLERPVALKIMLPMLAIDDQFVARFRREAQTAAQLEHPNIVRVYAIGAAPTGQPYIAMQFVDGGDLQQVIQESKAKKQPLTAVQTLTTLRPMADALIVAHAAAVIHRDLKPSNILLRPDGTPIMVDLGIAAVQTGAKLTNTGTLIGTPAYMSPEQARGLPVDGRSDLYSLGVILYEMLTGRRPFEADDPLAILHKHVYEEPVPIQQLRPDIAPETAKLVHRCLQKEPGKRPANAAELLGGIEYALEAESGQPASLSIPHPQPEPEATPSNWRSFWLGFGAVVVVMLIAVGVFFLINNPITITGAEASSSQASAGSDKDEEAASEPPPAEDEPEDEAEESTPVDSSTPNAADTPVPDPTATTPLPTNTAPPTATIPPTETAVPPTATAVLIETQIIGQSVNNLDIEAVRFGNGPNVVIFVGGLHAGAAPSSVALANRAISYFRNNLAEVPANVTLYIIPNANPDSPYAPGELAGRLNANDVDLNRNWDCRWVQDARWRNNVIPGSGGTAPFSEPETQALANFITEHNPVAVVFWEARATNGLSSPGFCEGSTLVSGTLATLYGQAAGYPIGDFENLTNQELNGDGTNWLDGQGIPAIAVLLPDYESVDWSNNLAAMQAVLSTHDN
ncbi:protein kinase domain-containing protein [Candidatus Leptofilum sp.]|uniref:protein kinase domain-containing protein n=1 Tax=Candidatus Leptofilum sp. TaxID=3241576 RepID=UPI003B5B95AD